MMLRRRTERKAKLAASTLFKRVASGQDWSPNSPSVPLKQISKVVAAKSVKQIKNKSLTARCTAVTAFKVEDANRSQKCRSMPKKETTSGLQKPSLTQKDRVKVQQKFGNLLKKENSTIPQLFGKSPIKDVRVQKKLGTSPKKEDGKVLAKSSMSSKKEVAWMPRKSFTLPKKDVKVSQKLDFLPDKVEDKVLQRTETLPKKDSAQSLQKSVSSLKTGDVNMPQEPTNLSKSTSVITCPVTENTENRRYSEKRKTFTRQKVAGRTDSENKESVKDLKVTTSPPRHEAVGAESLPWSVGVPQTRKRKLDFELNVVNNVCVKLTKLDEKNLTGSDLSIEKSVKQDTIVSDIPTCLRTALPLTDVSISCNKTRESIAYPSDYYTSIDFLTVIGLVRKSEVKKLDGSPNKLHREAGGKLRRILKPRLMPGMVYRRATIARGLSVKGIIIGQEQNRGSKSVASVSTAVQNVSHVKSTKQTSSAVSNFTLLRSQKPQSERMSPKVLVSKKLSKASSPLKPESRKVNLVSTSGAPESSGAAGEGVSTNVMAVNGKNEKEKKVEDCTVIQSPAKQKCLKVDVKTHHSDTIVPDIEPMARRSARQQGHRRRAWGHLLWANPDEFEESSKWENLNKDASRDLTKTCYQENSAKCLSTESQSENVEDIVSGAEDVLAAIDKDERTEKHKEASSECQDLDSNHRDISSASLLEETLSDICHPHHSASANLKMSPGCHRPTLQAGKKWKNMSKESEVKINKSKEKAVTSLKLSKPLTSLPKKKKVPTATLR